MGHHVALEELLALRRQWQVQGLKVAFTNGVFDILHRGHVEYLQKARALSDLLIVGLNTDDSVRRLKGEGRPIVPQEDRDGDFDGAALRRLRRLFHGGHARKFNSRDST
jgi:rfaE bifunctional protein nucleotidyltransferase chain/domain